MQLGVEEPGGTAPKALIMLHELVSLGDSPAVEAGLPFQKHRE